LILNTKELSLVRASIYNALIDAGHFDDRRVEFAPNTPDTAINELRSGDLQCMLDLYRNLNILLEEIATRNVHEMQAAQSSLHIHQRSL